MGSLDQKVPSNYCFWRVSFDSRVSTVAHRPSLFLRWLLLTLAPLISRSVIAMELWLLPVQTDRGMCVGALCYACCVSTRLVL